MRLLPSDPDISTVVSRIADGTLDLQPDFQRGLVWSKSKQRLLIDSVLRNWYVPPVHIIRTADERQEVLDGQQRLNAIWQFTLGTIVVDGYAEPRLQSISELHGLTYHQLPDQIRRRFDRFTLRVFELVDYEPEEPWELFFRLNQPTALTSAEKRNAFFGPARNQINQLTEHARSIGMTSDRIGFSNARMAYEDLVARFVWSLEVGSLAEKVTASRVTERYRVHDVIPSSVLGWAMDAIGFFFGSSALDDPAVRLNKATIHSWLCFSARSLRHLAVSESSFGDFIVAVEAKRSAERRPSSDRLHLLNEFEQRALQVFNDRASARVNDVSSVILRDVILWCLWALDGRETWDSLNELFLYSQNSSPETDIEQALLRAAEECGWGSLT